MKKLTIGIALVAMIIAIGGYLYPKIERVETPQAPTGAIPGPDVFNHMTFNQGFTKGGNVVATTSAVTAYTLAPNEWNERTSYVSWTSDRPALTLTTMASSSAPFVNLGVGESFSTYFYSATTTAAATITFAAGTGVDLQEDEGETVIINGLEVARLTFLKKDNSDVILWVEMGQVGD